MTGCPNGCARPYNSDIGLVGKTEDKYTIFLGGRVLGDRLELHLQRPGAGRRGRADARARVRATSKTPGSRANRSATSATAWATTTCWPTADSLLFSEEVSRKGAEAQR